MWSDCKKLNLEGCGLWTVVSFLKNEACLVELLKHLKPQAADLVTQQQEGVQAHLDQEQGWKMWG